MTAQTGLPAHALGRRDTIKCLSAITVGTLLGPLSGCSGSPETLAELATGTWKVTFPSTPDREPLTVSITQDGSWWLTDDEDGTASGAWRLESTNLTISQTGSNPIVMRENGIATGSGVPHTVEDDPAELPSSIIWAYDHDGGDVPLTWDPDSQTLTLTGARYDNSPFPIVATRTSDSPGSSPAPPPSTDGN